MPVRLIPALLLLAICAPARGADTAAVITRARAFLGGDAALDSIKSVHFVGTYEDLTDGVRKTGTIEMIFQKPNQHLATIKLPASVEITGLDDYESWFRVQDPANPARQRMQFLGKDQTRGLRANTWETLSFFAGIEKIGGRVIDRGEATVDGIVCDRIAFEHDASLVFNRYFDRETGRLVLTETAQGATREEGSQIVQGVRFPQKMVSRLRTPAGRERVVTLTFDRITVNETYPASIFRVPSLRGP